MVRRVAVVATPAVLIAFLGHFVAGPQTSSRKRSKK
jgi:hypothetical protein